MADLEDKAAKMERELYAKTYEGRALQAGLEEGIRADRLSQKADKLERQLERKSQGQGSGGGWLRKIIAMGALALGTMGIGAGALAVGTPASSNKADTTDVKIQPVDMSVSIETDGEIKAAAKASPLATAPGHSGMKKSFETTSPASTGGAFPGMLPEGPARPLDSSEKGTVRTYSNPNAPIPR
jgi:hypothetical protein